MKKYKYIFESRVRERQNVKIVRQTDNWAEIRKNYET